MEYSRIKTAVIGSLLSGSMMLSVGIMTNAIDSDYITVYSQNRTEIIQENTNTESNSTNKLKYHDSERKLNQTLDALVKDGSLKEERAKEIKKYVKKNAEIKTKSRKHLKKMSIIAKLQKENVITKEEAKLILEKFKTLREERLSVALNSLVERKVITEEKAKEVKSYLEKANEERRSKFSKIKSMTEDERKEYFKNNRKERINIFNKMVEEGIITEEQSKELKKVLKESM